MVLRTFISVICLSFVLLAQQVGLAQNSYSDAEFDDSWRLISEDRSEPRAGRCRHDRYRDNDRPTSPTTVDGDDWSRTTPTTTPYTVVSRSSAPKRYTTTTPASYPTSTVRSSTQYRATAPVTPPSYNVAPRAPAQYRAPVQYSTPAQYSAQYRSSVPTSQAPSQAQTAAYSNAATWPRYDGARSYPVTTAGYRPGVRPVPTASSPYYYGTSIYGSPMIYAKDQPVRNWLRSLLP